MDVMRNRINGVEFIIFYEDRGVTDLLLNYIDHYDFVMKEYKCSN